MGLYEDLKNAWSPLIGLTPQTVTGAVNGTGVDMDGLVEGAATLVVGAVTALTSLDVRIQESDTSGGTYTDITGAAFPTVTAATKIHVINFKRSKRFIRAALAMTGTSAAVACSIAGRKKVL